MGREDESTIVTKSSTPNKSSGIYLFYEPIIIIYSWITFPLETTSVGCGRIENIFLWPDMPIFRSQCCIVH